nr:hypothetical protein HK105_001179 [Polyrhizophydium stewartii]
MRRRLAPVREGVDVVVADAADAAAIDALAASTAVLVSAVGPFWTHGPAIVEACIRHGTHYLDCTGETHFIKKLIEELHDKAVAAKTVIMPACAFEPFLPDLGAFLVARHLRTKGAATGTVRYSLVKLNAAGISGGTIHSLSCTLALGKAILGPVDSNPSCLEPPDTSLAKQPVRGPPTYFYDRDLASWQSWFVPAAGNIRLARRSAALLGYGPSFSFVETLAHGNSVAAFFAGVGQVVVFSLLHLAFIRALLAWLIPVGSGPSAAKMKTGSLDARLFGESADKPLQQHRCVGSIRYGQDPGYRGTAVLLGEAAICLATQGSELRQAAANRPLRTLEGGVLTGASALGNTIIERLERAGFELHIDDE